MRFFVWRIGNYFRNVVNIFRNGDNFFLGIKTTLFGSNLKKYLFDGITEFTSESIIAEIRRCISEYEPRVRVVSINNASTLHDTENNTV